MRVAFIETLLELAAKDKRVCLLTGDLGFSVLERFAKAHPDRFFNVGVAEANMMGLATGLALEGWIPYCYSIATFASMRGYEQVRNGPVLHRLPVRIIGIGGGFAYGHAGPTHFALEDLGIARIQPDLAVIAPVDPAQTRSALLATHEHPGPIYFRIGKGGDVPVPGFDGRFSLSGVETVGSGKELLILTTGSLGPEIAGIAQELSQATAGLVATLNPAPTEALGRLLGAFPRVLVVEEHYVQGGLGSLVAESVAAGGRAVAFRSMGVREVPSGLTGSRDYMRRKAGLDRASILAEAKKLLASPRP